MPEAMPSGISPVACRFYGWLLPSSTCPAQPYFGGGGTTRLQSVAIVWQEKNRLEIRRINAMATLVRFTLVTEFKSIPIGSPSCSGKLFRRRSCYNRASSNAPSFIDALLRKDAHEAS